MLIRTKLLSGFFVLLLFFIISSYSSWNSQGIISEQSKQIMYLDEGTAKILESNIAIRRFIASQSNEDAKAARLAMDESVIAIKQSMQYDMSEQQSRRVASILNKIKELQSLFATQEQSALAMKDTIQEAIHASGKAFDSIAQIVAVNIANLRREALPRRIEAAELLDKIKGLFLLSRNQFTTYRLTNTDASAEQCLNLLVEGLETTKNLENFFQDPRQKESTRATAQAISNYKNSFEKFMLVQTRMYKSQEAVRSHVEAIRAENQAIVDSATALLEQTQARDAILTLVLTITAVLVSVLVALWILASISRPLSEALAFAHRVSSGDFTATWHNKSTDEFGKLSQSLNKAFTIVADKVFWYESILHSLPFMLGVMDNDKRFTFANIRVQKMLGKSMDEMCGEPCSIWGAPICNTPNCAITCIQDGKSEVLFDHSEAGHFRAMAAKLYNKDKQHVGYVDMVFDINEEMRLKKYAEQALASAQKQTVAALESVVHNLNTTVDELSFQVDETSRDTGHASQRIVEIATAMEEMNATVLEVARNADSASNVSNEAKSKVELGKSTVNDVIKCMSSVEEHAGQLKNDMVQLEQYVEGIGTIMNVISDIADQTNLLALNAAIEAARAGEAGRGFAVVADEVRKLAEKTMQATVEVTNSIKSVQESTGHSLKSVEESVESISTATQLAQDAGTVLVEIVNLVDNSVGQVATIATAAEQQSATSQEINRAVGDVNNIASGTSHSMEQALHSVANLTKQAQHVAKILDEMRMSSTTPSAISS